MRRPCLTAGCPNLTTTTRCHTCETRRQARRKATRTQYTGSWARLSRTARAAQPWCTRCHTTTHLSLDHETGTVLCVPCNSARRRNPGEKRGPDVIR